MILEWLETKQITSNESVKYFIERSVKKPDLYAIILGVEPNSHIAIDKKVYSSLIYDNQHGRYLCEYKHKYSGSHKNKLYIYLSNHEAEDYIQFYEKRGAKAIY